MVKPQKKGGGSNFSKGIYREKPLKKLFSQKSSNNVKAVNAQTRVCSNHDILENCGATKEKRGSKYAMCIVVEFIL